MTLNEFMGEFKHYVAEFKIANGREPNTLQEFEQYLLDRKNRISKPRNAKSINWLFSGKR